MERNRCKAQVTEHNGESGRSLYFARPTIKGADIPLCIMNGPRKDDNRILGQGVRKVDEMNILLCQGYEKVVLQQGGNRGIPARRRR